MKRWTVFIALLLLVLLILLGRVLAGEGAAHRPPADTGNGPSRAALSRVYAAVASRPAASAAPVEAAAGSAASGAPGNDVVDQTVAGNDPAALRQLVAGLHLDDPGVRARVAGLLGGQARDDAWAGPMENALRQNAQALGDARLDALSCRSSICRAEFTATGGDDGDMAQELRAVAAETPAPVTTAVQADSSRPGHYTLYVFSTDSFNAGYAPALQQGGARP